MVGVFTLLAFVVVLYQFAMLPDANVGAITAGDAYLLRIIDDLDLVPDAVQKIGRLLDIRRQIDQAIG